MCIQDQRQTDRRRQQKLAPPPPSKNFHPSHRERSQIHEASTYFRKSTNTYNQDQTERSGWREVRRRPVGFTLDLLIQGGLWEASLSQQGRGYTQFSRLIFKQDTLPNDGFWVFLLLFFFNVFLARMQSPAILPNTNPGAAVGYLVRVIKVHDPPQGQQGILDHLEELDSRG